MAATGTGNQGTGSGSNYGAGSVSLGDAVAAGVSETLGHTPGANRAASGDPMSDGFGSTQEALGVSPGQGGVPENWGEMSPMERALDRGLVSPNDSVEMGFPNSDLGDRVANFGRGVSDYATDPGRMGKDAALGFVTGGGPVGAGIGILGGSLRAGFGAGTGPGYDTEVGISSAYGESSGHSGQEGNEGVAYNAGDQGPRYDTWNPEGPTAPPTDEPLPPPDDNENEGGGDNLGPVYRVPRIRDTIKAQLLRKYNVYM